ncbi:hypothetical protein GOP47_0025750 [Adiantum capillus-veneris]|uniref:Secreted protein n=1 Tax=Adiantum capillus-veneris TaxID=13818 RepID=A0A9D4U3A9_ADICA|nr:hypothetical protein GOP47_0025750 [Adiantum capillus-veneris]
MILCVAIIAAFKHCTAARRHLVIVGRKQINGDSIFPLHDNHKHRRDRVLRDYGSTTAPSAPGGMGPSSGQTP